MELDPNGVDDQDEHQDDNWDDGHEPSGECESDWDTLTFELEKSFPHCTTLFCKERNIVHTLNGSLLQAASFKRQRMK